MLILGVALTLCHTVLPTSSKAQGCSDAGACSISGFKPSSAEHTHVPDRAVTIATYIGRADHDIVVYGAYVEYRQKVSALLTLDARVSTIAQRGNGLSTFGLSDVYVNATYVATDNVFLVLGTKIPLTDAGATMDGLPLPMDYQSSLGTFDVILGVGYRYERVQFSAAVQQPLTQNSNQFLASAYTPASRLSTFQSTRLFERSADIVVRASYLIPLAPGIALTPAILPIYHIADDVFTNEQNEVQAIAGSKGLTLNGNMFLDYEIGTNSILQLNAGFPFIVRSARPDGLTRSVVVNLEYKMYF